MKPLHVQAVGVQSRKLSTAQVVIFKPLNCNECGVSGAKERGLSSETHVLCITCAAVRYRLELESLELCCASNITGSSDRRNVGRGLNNDQHFDRHVPRALNYAILYATVHTRDQVSRLCTPSDSIEDLRRLKKKVRCNQ